MVKPLVNLEPLVMIDLQVTPPLQENHGDTADPRRLPCGGLRGVSGEVGLASLGLQRRWRLGDCGSRDLPDNSKSWPSISSHKRVVILRWLIAPLWLYVTLEGNIEMVDGLFIGQCGRTVVSFAQWKCAELVVLDNYSLAIVFVLRVLEYNAWYFARKQVHWKWRSRVASCCNY